MLFAYRRGIRFHGTESSDADVLRIGLGLHPLPMVGIFATGEVGPSPEWEDQSDEARRSKPQGFTTVFVVVKIHS